MYACVATLTYKNLNFAYDFALLTASLLGYLLMKKILTKPAMVKTMLESENKVEVMHIKK